MRFICVLQHGNMFIYSEYSTYLFVQLVKYHKYASTLCPQQKKKKWHLRNCECLLNRIQHLRKYNSTRKNRCMIVFAIMKIWMFKHKSFFSLGVEGGESLFVVLNGISHHSNACNLCMLTHIHVCVHLMPINLALFFILRAHVGPYKLLR